MQFEAKPVIAANRFSFICGWQLPQLKSSTTGEVAVPPVAEVSYVYVIGPITIVSPVWVLALSTTEMVKEDPLEMTKGELLLLPLKYILLALLVLIVKLLPEVLVMLIVSLPLLQPLHETLPTLLLAARPPSDVVVAVQIGVVVPLVSPPTPHPPVHFWIRPLVSTISALVAKVVDGVQGPSVAAVRALVMLKLMTQPPCVVADAPHEVAGTPAKSQSVSVLLVL